jgi:predicted dehydrogenase
MGVLGVCYEFDNVANTGSVYVRDKKAKNIGERNVYERGVKMFEAAIIGLGWWGGTITRTLKESKKIKIIAGVDIDEEHGKKFTKEHNINFHKHIDDALGDPKIKAIIIATPHGIHEEMFLASVKAGKEIFCEKPFALTSVAARNMISQAEAKGITIGIGHERRFEGAFEEIKRVVDTGELGTLLHLEFNASYNNMVKAPAKGWRKDPTQAPAGTMTALVFIKQTLCKLLRDQLIKLTLKFFIVRMISQMKMY